MRMLFHLSFQTKQRMKYLFVSMLFAVIFAFFIDQYFILGKQWYFLLELVG